MASTAQMQARAKAARKAARPPAVVTPRAAIRLKLPQNPCGVLEQSARCLLEQDGHLEEVERAMAEVRQHYGSRAVSECLYMARALAEKLPGAEVVGGYASWRVGPGDGDVVAHHPSVSGQAVHGGGGVVSAAYHVWVEFGPVILDVTTYALPVKLHALDALDGRHSSCLWSPLGLITAHSKATLIDVQQAFAFGLYYYERDDNVLRWIEAGEAGVMVLR